MSHNKPLGRDKRSPLGLSPKARESLINATEKGDLNACAELADHLDDEQNWVECILLINRGIANNHAGCIYLLAEKYANGRGVPKNSKEAIALAEMAFELGSMKALSLLIEMYQKSEEPYYSPEKQWAWITIAAKAKDSSAVCSIDPNEALSISIRLLKSTRLCLNPLPLHVSPETLKTCGIATDSDRLEVALTYLLPLSREERKCLDVNAYRTPSILQNSDEGCTSATGLVSRIFVSANSPLVNGLRGMKYLRLAASYDNQCKYHLATLLYQGIGTEVDRREAACLWHEVAESEAEDSILFIASCFAYGVCNLIAEGVGADLREARKWLEEIEDCGFFPTFECLGLYEAQFVANECDTVNACRNLNIAAVIGNNKAASLRDQLQRRLSSEEIFSYQEESSQEFTKKLLRWSQTNEKMNRLNFLFPISFDLSFAYKNVGTTTNDDL